MLIAQHAVLLGFHHRIGIPRSSLYFDQPFSLLAPVTWINVKHFTGPWLWPIFLLYSWFNSAKEAGCFECNLPLFLPVLSHFTYWFNYNAFNLLYSHQNLQNIHKVWFTKIMVPVQAVIRSACLVSLVSCLAQIHFIVFDYVYS